MEIDDLKDIWKKYQSGIRPKDEAELGLMLKGRSRSIVHVLKRNVWIELVFTFLGGVGLLAYALTLPDGSLKWTSVSILTLFAAYAFYYLKKIRLLKRYDAGTGPVRENLRQLIHRMEGYLKFYKRSYAILYPVYFLLGLTFAGIERGADSFFHQLLKPHVLITLIAGAVLFFICSTWLTGWYLEKLYGKHLTRLNRVLGDLETIEKTDNNDMYGM